MHSGLSVIFKFAQTRPANVRPERWQRFLSADDRLPTQGIPKLELPPVINRTISDDGVERLLALAAVNPWPRMYLFVLMLLTTGARKSETAHDATTTKRRAFMMRLLRDAG